MNKDIMLSMGYGEEVDMVELGVCPFCRKEVDGEEFRNIVSRKEFCRSGICQSCQDKTFKLFVNGSPYQKGEK